VYQFDDGASARSLISRFFKISGTLTLVAPDVFIDYVVSDIVETDVVAPIVVNVVISGVVVVKVAVVVVVVFGLRGSHPG